MIRSRRLAAPAVVGFAAVCLLTPAVAHDAAPAAEQVTLAESLSAADENPLDSGVYDIHLPEEGDEGWVAVKREQKGSTIWLAESLASPELRNNRYMSLRQMADGTGSDCGEDSVNFEGDDYRQHQFMSAILRSEGECATSDSVYYSHDAPSGFEHSEQVTTMAVWEEPPVEDVSLLPPPSLEQKWTGKTDSLPEKGDANLGATFAEAPDLTGGRWNAHVDPGKVALFRVPLDWNQHLELGMKYDGEGQDEFVSIEPVLITPLGGISEWGEMQNGAGDAPSFADLNLKYPTMPAGAVSPSITWRNREADGVTAAFPGTYYVMIKMGAADAPKQGVDFTMGVNVVTDKAAASPYAEEGDPVPDVGGHSEEEETGDEGEEKASGGSGDKTPWGAVSALFGGSAVMAAVGALALGRYRRIAA